MKPLVCLFITLLFFSCEENVAEKGAAEQPEKQTAQKQGMRPVLLDGTSKDTLIYPEEKHFKDIRQVTFGGDNAEAYWSFDDTKLIFQSNFEKWGVGCDQMFLMDAPETFKNSQPPMISTGKGRTTCAYFLPDDQHIVYASTHLVNENCPEVPLRKNGKYVWPVYDSFDIFVADLEGNITAQLTEAKGYDAEATVSPKGDKIVFTSMRSGDLELYTMNLDGSDVTQITDALGYDGGAFFSPDGTKLIFRASRPKTEAEITEYKTLLAQGLVQPTQMELFICNADGSDLKQLTNLGNANWSPFFTPDGKKILFSSNYEAERGFP
ncbi:MAG: TolB family protein, partial [Marinirhabdus sp.]